MLKKLLVTTAMSGLMVTAAMAQASTPTPPSASAPAAQPSAPLASPSASDSMKSDSKSNLGEPMKSPGSAATSGQNTTSSVSMSGAASSASTIAAQKPDQLLASKIKGADVVGSDDKKIGDVSDILFSKDGKIEAYILSVGGFLGVGAKEVALAPSSTQLTQDKDGDVWKIKVSMTKDQLAQAPNFEHYKVQRTTTGSGMAPSDRGSASAPRNAPSGGMAPANAPANRP